MATTTRRRKPSQVKETRVPYKTRASESARANLTSSRRTTTRATNKIIETEHPYIHMSRMTITDLTPENQQHIAQVATILTDAFQHIPDTWSTLDEALAEVKESFATGRISRVALDDNDNVIGWIGGIPEYDGNVYELHPLAVKPDQQGKGIGRALVEDFEAQVRQRGAMTIMLGTDDEFEGTNLYGVDLYPDIAARILGIENHKNHPYEFYQKCGYVIYGLLPDANGFGKPDILMSKRVGAVNRSNDAQE